MVCNSQRGNGTSLGARRSGDKAQGNGYRLMLYQSIDSYSCSRHAILVWIGVIAKRATHRC